MEKIKLGISTCLLGENVRYDGGHKLDRFLTETLGQFVDDVPVCPEVECGLPVPRESMHLEGDPNSLRLVTSRTKQEITDRMVQWARKRVVDLEGEDLCGFISKAILPAAAWNGSEFTIGRVPQQKRGWNFCQDLHGFFPLIPVEDEGRLNDPDIRENFIERIFALKRWREILAKKESRGNLVDFHTTHKLLILSHSANHYQTMGKLVAKAKDLPLKELYQQYQSLLMEALQLKTTPKKNSNVLMHMMGYFKEELSSDEKKELLEVIENYRREILPLIVPITLMNHYVRKYDQP
jgi:uncharacterized protein YbgA (DUF1722 family)/uncharacterized protein YbbK (DUF523 family)